MCCFFFVNDGREYDRKIIEWTFERGREFFVHHSVVEIKYYHNPITVRSNRELNIKFCIFFLY